jgi:hypothetical protein
MPLGYARWRLSANRRRTAGEGRKGGLRRDPIKLIIGSGDKAVKATRDLIPNPPHLPLSSRFTATLGMTPAAPRTERLSPRP